MEEKSQVARLAGTWVRRICMIDTFQTKSWIWECSCLGAREETYLSGKYEGMMATV